MAFSDEMARCSDEVPYPTQCDPKLQSSKTAHAAGLRGVVCCVCGGVV